MSAPRLPKKEHDMFRLVVTSYENKKYTKGIQTADAILKKFPNHGETQSMKGLILNCMGKKEEALELVKNGVRNDVRSHVCWHVFGLIHKSDNNFPEAIKCYLNALKIDENNQNILRDLSWLQVQIRDLEGFVVSRNKILEAKPTIRASWVTAAVANYMNEQYQVAYDMITKYKNLNTTDKGDAYEEGELLLFQNRCLEKLNKYQEAIDHLKTNNDYITDKLSIQIKIAELELLNNNYNIAKELWMNLIISQPDNYRFHCGLQSSYLELNTLLSSNMLNLKRLDLPCTVLNLDTNQIHILKELYTNLINKFKRSAANKIIMSLARGKEEIKNILDIFIKNSLHHAIPSLVQDICSLIRIPNPNQPDHLIYATDAIDIRQHEVTQVALSLVDSYIMNLKEHSQFDLTTPSTTPEPPSALLWALYFKCHFLELTGELDHALQVIDEAIAHTPTALDMYGKRARIQKKQGDLTAAAITMDECRMLDLQDRYLNNKATKYFLRADEIPMAMNTIAMFTKHEGDPQQTLYELQCNWYELELAESYARSHQWGAALRKFYAIRKHFTDYNEDMFDFHGYCMRKTTLRAYFDTVRMLDDSFTHKFYQRATRGALRIFLYLHEFPEDVDGLGHLPPAERKKERMKLKKAKKKAEDKQAEDAAAGENGDEKDEKTKKLKITEPDEDTLLTKDFMAEALAWTAVLSKRLTHCDAETIALLVDMNVRKGEYTTAIDAVRIGLDRFPDEPCLVHSLVRLAAKVKSPGKKSLGANAPEIRDNVSKLLGCAAGQIDIESFVVAYSARAVEAQSLPMVLAAIKIRVVLDKSSPATIQAVGALLGDAKLLHTGRGVTAAIVLEACKFLTTNFPEENFTTAFKALAREHFPHAAVYAPLNTVEEIRTAAALANVAITTTDTVEDKSTELKNEHAQAVNA